ncbi:MAG: EAL domain-containing protein [Gammaproteobacteria bacterium]|nr:EAL domain-containing protein [Gammaproteobacteria bacterium]
MRLRLPSSGLVILLTLTVVLAVEFAVEVLVRQHELRREQEQTLAVLNGVRARVEKLIYRDLYVVRALANHIAAVPDIDQAGFDAYVQRLLRTPTALSHVAAAPNLTIRFVYPLAGNEALLGMDYLAMPAQRAAVNNTILRRTMMISGPIALRQGGSGFVAREPVILPTETGPPAIWGLVAAVIKQDELYRVVGLDAARTTLDIAVRADDIPDGAAQPVFYGNATVFSRDSVRTIVNLPIGRWVIAAHPRAGWLAGVTPTLWLMRLAALALAAVLAALLQSRARHLREQMSALEALQRSEQALRRSRQDLINAIDALAEGFALWNQQDRLEVYNQQLPKMLPALAGVIQVGMPFQSLVEAMANLGVVGSDEKREDWIARRLEQHRAPGGALEVRTRAGRTVSISEYHTADGYVVGLYTDVTEIRAAEEHIRYRAYFDPLTALPNRENFMNQLAQTVAESQRDQRQFALLFVDLDRFKNVNDTLGHAVGDKLLVEAGKRLTDCLRHSDTVARFGGDEFTVIMRDIDNAMNAAHCAETLIEALTEGFELAEQVVHTGASIGITLYPVDGADGHTLLRNADMAMYRAKARGRNTFRFFAAEMTTRAEHFVALEKDLRLALSRRQFDFDYQPVVRLDDGALAGAEALLRWRHPQRGAVSPGEFIPVAEETRLIVDIGAWALRHACRTAAAWCARDGGALPRLAVNVSGRQLWGGFDGAFVAEVLAESGFPAERLVFEMTESLLIDEDRRVGAILREFRDLGIGIALDDFGTGYSALGYLRRFPVTMLKIDRSFVGDIESNVSDARLVESIIALGRALNLTVVAEGVESAGQAALLRNLGCELAQGYFFARPMAAGDFEKRYGM